MKKTSMLVSIASGCALFFAGVVAGQLAWGPTFAPVAPQAIGPVGQDALQSASMTARSPRSGPFTYKFKPGERLGYRLLADVKGEGAESIGPSPVSVNMDSLMTLTTLAVRDSGEADLRLDFPKVTAGGDFMGSPYTLNMQDGQTYLDTTGKPSVDTAHGVGSIQGIPQLEFFSKPVMMTVGPSGEVLSVMGAGNLASMLGTVHSATMLEFPEGDMQQGFAWKSKIKLPIPGFDDAPNATLDNVFLGYQEVSGRTCGVIQQEMRSEQQDGGLSSPESALGKAMPFTIPKFGLTGRNYIYFDTTNGQLVASTMNLQLLLQIGQVKDGAMPGLQQGIDAISKLVNGTLPGDTSQEASGQQTITSPPKQQNLLDLTLNIQGSLALVGQDTVQTSASSIQTGGNEREPT